MKLTEEQINIIRHYTDGYRIDREKLVSYLEKHKTIKSEVFSYCSKVSKRDFGSRGYCMYLDDEPMYTPVDRDTFIRRVPFYFCQVPVSKDSRSGLSFIIPVKDKKSSVTEDYDAFYADLEWMFYSLGIPVETIFLYSRDQVTPPPEPKDESPRGLFSIRMSRSMFQEGGLDGRQLFRYWRHYLHLCVENGLSDYMPARFITAYNEVLEKSGQAPIIYYPIKEYGSAYTKDENAIVCSGHFPCDKDGNPIFKWMSIRVKHPGPISYDVDKSKCGELRIGLAPKTIMHVLDGEDGEMEWEQIYAGPQTMEFDNEALREYRRMRNMTQSNVAEAIGTSVRTYQKWESGETTPDGHYLLRLMNWLDIDSVQRLVKYIDPPDAEDDSGK